MTNPTDHLEYYQRDDGIHVVIILRSSPQATDAFVALWGSILRAVAPAEVVRLLIDLRPDGPLPFQLIAPQVQKVQREYLSPQQRLRSVYLLEQGSARFGLLKQSLQLVRSQTKRNFFEGEAFDEAVAWLNEG